MIFIGLNENQIVTSYGVPLNEGHIPIVNGIQIEIEEDFNMENLCFNYKYINDELIELLETEKEEYIPNSPPTTEEMLKEQANKITILESENKKLKEISKEQDKILVDNAYQITMIKLGGI